MIGRGIRKRIFTCTSSPGIYEVKKIQQENVNGYNLQKEGIAGLAENLFDSVHGSRPNQTKKASTWYDGC